MSYLHKRLVDHLLSVSLIRIPKGRIEGMWADKTNERAMGATLIISSSWFCSDPTTWKC
jgi:hypothetical protein